MNQGMINRIAKKVISSAAEKEVERLFKKLLPSSPFAGKAFSVGGYVRDELLGVGTKDLDVVVNMQGGAGKMTKWLHREFPSISRPRQMRNYPIWVIAFKEDVKYKGEVYNTSGAEVEFADSQKESFPDESSRDRLTEPGTLEEDSQRRDFTVNMLLRDLSSGELLDLTGTSIKDIKEGILRGHHAVDFGKILNDDPLRMMRLVRFQVKYGWKIPMDVLRTVKKNAGRIKIVSGERIRDELIKIMKLGKLSQAIRLMKAVGLLQYVLPEIEAMKGVMHDLSRGHHQEGDVLKHTILVLKNAKPGVESQLAALLHDVGKPKTQEILEDKIQFLGHETVGGEMAEAIMRRLKFERTTVKSVRRMVENHMRPHDLGRGGAGTKALRRFVRKVGEETYDAILDLAEADALGNLPPRNYIPELRKQIDEAMQIPVSQKSVLNGKEIMDLLGMGEGIQVGEAIQFVKDMEDESAARGEELGKAEATKLILDKFRS